MCVTVLFIAQLCAWGMYRISTEVGIIILHLAKYMLRGTRYKSKKKSIQLHLTLLQPFDLKYFSLSKIPQRPTLNSVDWIEY